MLMGKRLLEHFHFLVLLRTFLWRNYTFDLYGVTNINNGQQYQFKHPYEKNTYGFADFNYNPNSNNKVINNTNILTGI